MSIELQEAGPASHPPVSPACPRITMGRVMATVKPNKHAQRTQATRERLLRAAEAIFVRDGYEGAELGEIAALAGRTKGAIYAHYKSKEDIFLALIRERALGYRARMEQLMAPSSTPQETRETYREFCLSAVENTDWALLMLEYKLYALRHPEAKARLEDYYAEMLPEGSESRFAQLLGPTGSDEHAVSRSAAVQSIHPLLSTLAIESLFASRLLNARTRRQIAERIFDALVPESPRGRS